MLFHCYNTECKKWLISAINILMIDSHIINQYLTQDILFAKYPSSADCCLFNAPSILAVDFVPNQQVSQLRVGIWMWEMIRFMLVEALWSVMVTQRYGRVCRRLCVRTKASMWGFVAGDGPVVRWHFVRLPWSNRGMFHREVVPPVTTLPAPFGWGAIGSWHTAVDIADVGVL